MGRIAWLSMYDHPAQHGANDRFWAAIRDRLRDHGLPDVPDRLTRGVATGAVWSHPDLLLGMICTRPWAREHPGLRLLGHPVYAGTDRAGEHRSLIVVRRDDPARDLSALRGRVAAINDAGSNTGMALLRDRIAPLAGGVPFFRSVITTGAHADSVVAVGDGRADVAAIDEVTFAALARHDPVATGRLRILDTTDPAATPAFVTAAPPAVATLLGTVLAQVLADPVSAEARATLFLTGMVPPHPDLPARIVAQDARAAAAGHFRLS
ncbi:PhnD/SsuA/transferrin family substrate-binding protein [uncultured Sphingomonas sp.]|uniref:phosphate/phosphite/phosphonate ABC transporter substrate-binding protein n=1 Tax=uncultured Sphingomonas sp. TaxID=158754 RepID=UPI0025EEFCD7|nr:PhnD/SsuA/transferrin family substrate-binding protein [uncultured Sphingomonas sp.]